MSLGIGTKLFHVTPEKYSHTTELALHRTHRKLSADWSAMFSASENLLCCKMGFHDVNRTKRPLAFEFSDKPHDTPDLVLPTSRGAGNEEDENPEIVIDEPLVMSVFGCIVTVSRLVAVGHVILCEIDFTVNRGA